MKFDNRKTYDRWKALSKIQKRAPFSWSVSKCMRVPVGSPQIVKANRVDGSSYTSFRGLHTCKSAWSCPICSPSISAHRASVISRMFEGEKSSTAMVTYTIQHQKSDRLSGLIDVLYDSLRQARSGSRLKQFKSQADGYIRATEITYGKNGWHPHIHEMIVLSEDGTMEGLKSTVARSFMSAVKKSGLALYEQTVKIDEWDGNTEYITKDAEIGELTGWANKKSVNIMDIASRIGDDDESWGLYCEYFEAVYRRKKIIVSRSLSDRYKKADSDVNKEMGVESVELLHKFTVDEWREVVRADVRFHVIAHVSGSGIDFDVYSS